MTPERWQQIKFVLQQVLGLSPQQRSGFLAEACSDDPALRQEPELTYFPGRPLARFGDSYVPGRLLPPDRPGSEFTSAVLK
jgi:hypothetical protein